MACNCGKRSRDGSKNSPPPTGGTGATATNPASSAQQGVGAVVQRNTGQTQSFTLGAGRGRQSFGSQLERDAAAVRARKVR